MSNSKIWFILCDGHVVGPCTQEEIEQRLVSTPEAQIWSRGQTEWLSPVKWRKLFTNNPQSSKAHVEPPHLWRLRDDENKDHVVTYAKLISYLKNKKDLSSVELSPSDQAPQWKSVFTFPQIADDLGITRREHSRVPLVGTLTCHGDHEEFTCRVISISEGGMGINNAFDLVIGQKFKTTLHSSNLLMPVSATCEVVYIGGDGYAGLRFVGLPAEVKSSILDYVKKFATF